MYTVMIGSDYYFVYKNDRLLFKVARSCNSLEDVIKSLGGQDEVRVIKATLQ